MQKGHPKEGLIRKISWNGATKETHEKIMKGSKWEVVTENLKIFLGIRDKYFSDIDERCTVTLHQSSHNVEPHEYSSDGYTEDTAAVLLR
jgi:hypothetical protein